MAVTAGLGGLFLVAEMSDLLGQGPKYDTGKADGFDASVYVRIPARSQRLDILRMKIMRKSVRPKPIPIRLKHRNMISRGPIVTSSRASIPTGTTPRVPVDVVWY